MSDGKNDQLLDKKEILSMVTINEAYKIYDRLLDYCSAIDAMQQLKEIDCD